MLAELYLTVNYTQKVYFQKKVKTSNILVRVL